MEVGPWNISHQHHPTYLDNGHVLLDNGSHRRGLSYSRVIEVDPPTSEVVWQYRGLPMVSFFTHFTGGAQRLSNGNTLITEGLTGRLFEVTPGNEIVWELRQPLRCSVPVRHGQRRIPVSPLQPRPPGFAGKSVGPGAIRKFQSAARGEVKRPVNEH